MWGAWYSAVQNWGWIQFLFGTALSNSYNNIVNTAIW